MVKPKEIVLAFQQAIGKKDFQAARKLLQDTLEFRGPIDTFHRADDLHAMQKLSAIVEGVDILKVFEEGNDVSLFCDLKTKTFGTSFVAEWCRVNDGTIASVRVVFEAPVAEVFRTVGLSWREPSGGWRRRVPLWEIGDVHRRGH